MTSDYKGVAYDAFDPEKYVATYYSTIAGHKEEGDVLKFFLDGLNEAFKSGDITGKKLLDVGTGPIPNMAFCAAPWFEEITLSDFSQKNLEFLKKWKVGEINHMGPVFEYLLQLDKSGCLERMLKNWDALKVFFSEEKKAKQSSYAQQKVESIFQFISSPTNKLFGFFLKYVHKEILEGVLVLFQSEEPQIHLLQPHLKKLLRRIMTCFVCNNHISSMEERQDELRRKIRNIVFCDVTAPNPVASTAVDGVIFDAITCSNCLEVASITLDNYAKSVRNLSSLLRPGGHLVLEGALEQTFYRVGEFRFECTPINENQLRDIFQKEGFEIISLQDLNENYSPHKEESNYSDFKNAFAMVAKKVE